MRAGFEPATRPLRGFSLHGHPLCGFFLRESRSPVELPHNPYKEKIRFIFMFSSLCFCLHRLARCIHCHVFLFPASSGSGCNYSGWSDALAACANPGMHDVTASAVSPVNIPVYCQWKQLITRYTGVRFNLSPPSYLVINRLLREALRICPRLGLETQPEVSVAPVSPESWIWDLNPGHAAYKAAALTS